MGLRAGARRAQQAELHHGRFHAARRRQRPGRVPRRRRGGAAGRADPSRRRAHARQPGAHPAVRRAGVRSDRRPGLPDPASARALEHGRGHRTASGLRAEGAIAGRGGETSMAGRAEPRARPTGRLPRGWRPLAPGAAPDVSFTTGDGRKLTYRKLGHGPVLVCHPGGPGFSADYFGDLAALWEQFTLIMLNPRGTGASDRPRDPRAYQIDDYVDDVEELRRHLGLERMLLLGHSHGGMVAQAYAAKHPQHVHRLVLASTLPRFGPKQEAAMQRGIDKRSNQPWASDAI